MLHVATRTVACLLALAASLARADSWVDTYAKARPRAQEVCTTGDLGACQQALLELERLVGPRLDIEYRLARIEAQRGRDDAALKRLKIYARSGLDLGDPAQEPAFATLRRSGGLREILDGYRRGLAAKEVAHVSVASLEDPDLLAEDIVCERDGGSFLVSSVRERKIVRVDGAANSHELVTDAQPPLWGVFALGLDRTHQLLWATTSAIAVSPPFEPRDRDRSAVLAFDLQSGRMVSRYELPRGARHAFGDMSVSPGGTVYISDGLGGGVYSVAPGSASELNTLVAPGQFVSPQTPALSRDGSRLLVPDYVRGIALVDLNRRSISWVSHPPELATFGIDGLYLDGQILVAVQNGTTPERIVLMRLTADLSRVARWRVLLARAPGLGDPTHGCLQGSDFYLIANSGWNQFQEDGRRKADSPPSSAEIWKIRIPADF